MKYKPDKNQISWGITIFVSLSACIFIAFLFQNASVIGSFFQSIVEGLAPILWGIIIAFLLNPVLNFIERKWLAPHYYKKQGINVFLPENKKTKMKMRSISVLLSILFLVAILIAIICIVVPQLVMSIQTIVANFSSYQENVNHFFINLAGGDKEVEKQITDILITVEEAIGEWYETNIAENMSEIIQEVTSTVVSFGKGIWNFVIGVIVSIYLLYTKDTLRGQAKKLVYSLFKERTANEIIGAFRYIDITFIGFLTGKLLDSLIIGILCFIATSIIGTPFPALISVIVGITNIVPFFGPWIGAIVGGIIIFMISPIDCLWFIILCLVLQIFDGYILGPKILGDSTGLSNFWVIFAIMFFGGMFGFIGWIIGVPLFACIYEFSRRFVNHMIRKRNIQNNSSEHMQEVAYFENGEEHELGDPNSTRYYAGRVKGHNWAKLLGIDRIKKNKKDKKEEEETKDQQK